MNLVLVILSVLLQETQNYQFYLKQNVENNNSRLLFRTAPYERFTPFRLKISIVPLFQSETKSENDFDWHENEIQNSFSYERFHTLKQRQKRTRKWHIAKHGEMPVTQHSYKAQIGHYQV